uniref:Uncharacterized protein n=1 Tax=Sphaerodactylus townsendi TaxID=933632 RepID=A0ACB8G1R3_9SAUR
MRTSADPATRTVCRVRVLEGKQATRLLWAARQPISSVSRALVAILRAWGHTFGTWRYCSSAQRTPHVIMIMCPNSEMIVA